MLIDWLISSSLVLENHVILWSKSDTMSPYLFVIAMNVLSLMLNKAAAEAKIKYHHKCYSSKLTHLCFADDLLIFIDGSLSSVQNVLQVLKEFELRSGLGLAYRSLLSSHQVLLIRKLTPLKPPLGCQTASFQLGILEFPCAQRS